MLYPAYDHQQETIDFLKAHDRAFIASTMGTGKTYSIIADIEHTLEENEDAKFLVIAPKSLVYSVWVNDFRKFAPHIIVAAALAPDKKRREAFARKANVYVINTDGVTWIKKNNLHKGYFDDFEGIIIDESTSFKHNSARTKALMAIRQCFPKRRCLSGTPTAGPLTDLFYQYFFLDNGMTLGTSFTRYRNQVQYAKQNGPQPNMVKWINKPSAEPVVAQIIAPITIRHELVDVVDMPKRISYSMMYDINAKVRNAYNDLRKIARTTLDSGEVTAVNAAALTTKLLQTLSGAVYDADGKAHLVDTQRYDLVLDIVAQTAISVVFYNWTSQREYLMEHAEKRGILATFIDGSVSNKERALRVQDFQAKKYQTIFLQVKAASHGLTLTAADTSIWTGPTYLADYYQQANARVFRIGQTKRTITINVQAKDTLESKVYELLNDKLTSIDILTEALK